MKQLIKNIGRRILTKGNDGKPKIDNKNIINYSQREYSSQRILEEFYLTNENPLNYETNAGITYEYISYMNYPMPVLFFKKNGVLVLSELETPPPRLLFFVFLL